jgi:spermidine/putrescine-binding protein
VKLEKFWGLPLRGTCEKSDTKKQLSDRKKSWGDVWDPENFGIFLLGVSFGGISGFFP